MNYIILSPGRTGGTLIAANLRSLKIGQDSAVVEHLPVMIEGSRIQFNAPANRPKHPNNNTPVFSRRRCIYDAVLSMSILEQTRESHHYTTDWANLRFTLPVDKFIMTYMYFLDFYNHVDLSVYDHPPVEIYYCQLIADPFYLFRQFGIEKETDYTLCNRSPARHHMITNLDEIREVCLKHRWAIE